MALSKVEEVKQLLLLDMACRQKDQNGIKMRENDIFGLKDIKISEWDDKELPIATSCYYKSENKYDSSLTDESLFEKMISFFPYLKDLDLDGVLIAGGSVMKCLQKETLGQNDLDLFLCGYDTIEALEKRIRKLGKDIINSIISNEEICSPYECDHPHITIIRSQHAITLSFKHWINLCDIQVILRKYDTPSQVLHGFDIGASAVGIWNKKLITTSLGKFAYIYNLNIFDLSRRSTNYEYRIFSKYFDYFDVIMPNLDLSKVKLDEKINKFFNVKTKSNNVINGYLTYYHIKSDYAPYINSPYAVDFHNINRILKAENGNVSGLWYSKICRTVKEVEDAVFDIHFNAPTFENVSNYIARKDIFSGGMFYVRRFTKCYVGLDAIEIFRKCLEFELTYQGYEKSDMIEKYLSPIRKQAKDNIMEKINSVCKDGLIVPVSWRLDNPEAQLTGSFYPVITTPEEWYGECYKEFKLE